MTNLAFEWLLVVVYTNVLNQIRLLCKPLRTNRASVFLDTIMDLLMCNEGTFLVERFAARHARERLASRMDSNVALKKGRTVETLFARRTSMALHSITSMVMSINFIGCHDFW